MNLTLTSSKIIVTKKSRPIQAYNCRVVAITNQIKPNEKIDHMYSFSLSLSQNARIV